MEKRPPAFPRVTILTGATGFLGREILATLLARSPEERVLVMVRPLPDRSARERLADLLGQMFPDEQDRRRAAERVDLLEAELSGPGVQLTPVLRDALVGRPVRIIHGAASVALDDSLEQARAVNVEGTRRMLDIAATIAEVAELESFAYIGTAFVAGLRSGTIYEDELDVGQRFHNAYEQSKCEAEKLVRSRRDRLPISIFRPSVIAGRSTTDFTTGFKTIYWPLKVFTRGTVLCIPGDPEARYDLVPVDFVARALLHILDRGDSPGGCYHLTSSSSITLDRAVRLTAEFFGVRRIPPYVPPKFFYPFVRPILYLLLWGKWREVLVKSKVIVPYLTLRLDFDNRNTVSALEGSGLSLPDIETYLETVYRWVLETDWGRKPLEPVTR